MKRCHCDFPDGPVKAAYCHKTNLVENTFAQLDRILLQNQLIDIDAGRAPWPRHGLTSGEHDRKKFWRGQLERAVDELNQDKGYFQRQYAGFLKRCKMFNGEETELFQILNTTDILYFILFFTVTNNCACQPYKP